MTKGRKRAAKQRVPDDTRPDDRTFHALMHQSGVEPLDTSKPDRPENPPAPASVSFSAVERVRFELENTPLPITQPISPPEKYRGAPKPPPRSPKRKIRLNRRFQPEVMIDLHGETRDSALQKTAEALASAHRKNQRSVLIITGKGLHSGQKGAILNRAIWQWLENHLKAYPMRLQKAPPYLGGGGAILVLLSPANL
jgi:DNA-nicking Smr family endonuclease